MVYVSDRRTRLRFLACLTALVALIPVTACAATITVNWDGTGDFDTIQAGVDDAGQGDTVLVMPGTYTDTGNRDITIGDVGITLLAPGGSGATTIDCEGSGRAFFLENIWEFPPTIRGFTVTNGSADDGGAVYCYHAHAYFESCTFLGNAATARGGGACCEYYSNTYFATCVFTGNTSEDDGGGLYHFGGSPAVLTDCVFTGNDAAHYGGGAYLHSESTLSGCDFDGNTARIGGGVFADYFDGSFTDCTFSGNASSKWAGGMVCQYGDPTLRGCLLAGNTAGTPGEHYPAGGIYLLSSDPEFRRCDFIGNSASSAGAIKGSYANAFIESCAFTDNVASFGSAGAVEFGNSAPIFWFSTFSGNSANQDAGAVYFSSGCSANLSNCTLVRNSASDDGGGVYASFGGSVHLDCCIVAFNESGGAAACYDGGTVTFACSDIFGNEGGDWTGCIADQLGTNANIDLDPCFCDIFGGDYTLCANSPCVVDTIGCMYLVGAHDQGCGDCESATRRTSWGAIKSLFR